jgi:hypothetical protein
MRFYRLPPQITRLVLLTIGIVAVYLVARAVLTPKSFGLLGWYRAEALNDAVRPEPVYAGKVACQECHAEQFDTVAAHEHRSLSCEACHGAAQDHAQNPDIKPAILNYSHCVRCHELAPSRPKWHKQINSKDHYTGSLCTECHIPHHPSEAPQ